jgi:hypothetical protein
MMSSFDPRLFDIIGQSNCESFFVRIRSDPTLPLLSSGVANYFKVEIAMTVKLERP